MWTNEHSLVTNAPKENIWRLWSDVENWHKWDNEILWCKLDSAWHEGATYTLKPKAGPQAKATVEHLEYLKSFSDVTRLPLAELRFVHTMTDTPHGTRLTHRIEISGVLSFLFAKVIGEKTLEGLPIAMNNLVRLAGHP